MHNPRMEGVDGLDEAYAITQCFDLGVVCFTDIVKPVEELV